MERRPSFLGCATECQPSLPKDRCVVRVGLSSWVFHCRDFSAPTPRAAMRVGPHMPTMDLTRRIRETRDDSRQCVAGVISSPATFNINLIRGSPLLMSKVSIARGQPITQYSILAVCLYYEASPAAKHIMSDQSSRRYSPSKNGLGT